jgi:hypothetical protein
MDFIVILGGGHVLIECKILSVSGPMKQRARNVREAIRQLDEHAALLQTEGWKLRGSACVVNLTEQDLASLQRGGFLASAGGEPTGQLSAVQGLASNRVETLNRQSLCPAD